MTLRKAAYAALCALYRLLRKPPECSLLALKKAGLVSPSIRLTCAGKTDGAGAQANAVMSALNFSRASGIPYLHTPFTHVAHAQGNERAWTLAWELFFNLGQDENRAGNATIISLKAFLRDPSLWDRDGVIVAAQHFHGFCNRHPDSYRDILPSLKAKYAAGEKLPLPMRANPSVIEVAVHIRRGDVALHDPATADRHTHDEAILNSVTLVLKGLSEMKAPATVTIYSEGREEDFRSFTALGCKLVIDGDAFETFQRLAAADVLLIAKSSFSYAAALLSDGVKLYEPFWTAPLSDWIVRDETGNFDGAAFSVQLKAARNGSSRTPLV